LVLPPLVACAEQPGPIDVVQSFMAAIEEFDLDIAEGYVCEAQKSAVRAILEPYYDVARLAEAFDMDFKDLTFTERSNDGETAVVKVSGSLTLSFLGREDTQEVSEEHVVIKEGGQWLVCDP
jgi:hypothetical protein